MWSLICHSYSAMALALDSAIALSGPKTRVGSGHCYRCHKTWQFILQSHLLMMSATRSCTQWQSTEQWSMIKPVRREAKFTCVRHSCIHKLGMDEPSGAHAWLCFGVGRYINKGFFQHQGHPIQGFLKRWQPKHCSDTMWHVHLVSFSHVFQSSVRACAH